MRPVISEEPVTLSFARQHLIPKRDGKPVNPSTLWRWVSKGLRSPDGSRICLEVFYRGKTPYTSREAISRFFERLTDSRLNPGDSDTGDRTAATEDDLRAEGLL